jgi:hypothetical protein
MINGLTACINDLIVKLSHRVLKDEGDIAAGHHAWLTGLTVTVDSATQAHIGLVEVGSQVLSLADNLLASALYETPTDDALVESIGTTHQPVRALFLFLAVIHIS